MWAADTHSPRRQGNERTDIQARGASGDQHTLLGLRAEDNGWLMGVRVGSNGEARVDSDGGEGEPQRSPQHRNRAEGQRMRSSNDCCRSLEWQETGKDLHMHAQAQKHIHARMHMHSG